MADELETDFDIDALPAAVQPPGAVLSVRNLRVDFKTDDGIVKAVDDVSYDVFENEVLGIVGESGSGKTVSSLAILGLLPPDVLIADEPTTALDVTIQAQVLEVFERVQAQTNSAILLITHDLGVVAGMADRVMVMYAGRQSEIGTVDEIFYEPRHPYTLSLLASLPRLDRGDRRDRLYRIKGQPPSLIRVPPGCPFNPRCPMAQTPDPCATEVPPLYSVSGGTEHRSACHFREQLAGVTVEQLRARVRA